MLHLRKHRKAPATVKHDDVDGRRFSPWRLGHDAHPDADCLLPVRIFCCLLIGVISVFLLGLWVGDALGQAGSLLLYVVLPVCAAALEPREVV
jgi:hypothetical protein